MVADADSGGSRAHGETVCAPTTTYTSDKVFDVWSRLTYYSLSRRFLQAARYYRLNLGP